MTSYRLQADVTGPAAPTAFSGDYGAGVVFQVTEGGLWFEGWWWWVATGQQTTPQKFALWEVEGLDTGVLIAGSEVTSAELADGWNFVAASSPIPLTPNVPYCANTAYATTTGFPATKNQFGSGDPLAAGLTSGPLMAYSSLTGSAEVPGGWLCQMPFETGVADPGSEMPDENDADDNLYVDVQVTDTAPAGATYRGFPNYPEPSGATNQSGTYTLGREFTTSQETELVNIWHYSPAGCTELPSRVGIWDVSTEEEVSGTDNSSPDWSGAAGSGWISVAYTDTVLPAGTYKVSRFRGVADGADWFAVTTSFWSTGPGSGGITAGPVTFPDNAAASPGQDSWNESATWTYPDTSSSPEADWGDVELQPVAAPAPSSAGSWPYDAVFDLISEDLWEH